MFLVCTGTLVTQMNFNLCYALSLIDIAGVSVMTFASIIYICEEGLAGHWTYLDSFWWALMTITTVGQDDNPQSELGKMSGGMCALVGVFLLTLPLPIVVNSFAGFYKNRMWRNEVGLFYLVWFI